MTALISFGSGLDLQNHIAKLYDSDIKELISLIEESDDEELKKEYAILHDDDVPEFIKKLFLVSKGWRLAVNTMGIPPDIVDDKGKVNYDILTDYVRKKLSVVTFSKILYIFDGKSYKDNIGEVEREIMKVLRRFGVTEKKKIQSITTEVIYRLSNLDFFREYPFNNLKGFISLKNGVLWVGNSKRILLPNSPVYGFTYNIPVEYNPEAKCHKIMKFLREITSNEDDATVLREIPALCLMEEQYPYSYMLVGSGANGKTTYLNLLMRFLGKENVSNLALQDLNSRFRLYRLVGKLANICGDIPETAISDTGTGIFKMLTGGDPVTVEKKFKEPFEYYNRAVMVFSANKLPEVKDMTDAFWRRWMLIKFPYKFKDNPNLLDELSTPEELSGFLNEIINSINKIREKGITISQSTKELKEEWLKRANSVYAFARDMLIRDKDNMIPNDEMYAAYRQYCDDNDFTTYTKKHFSQELERLVPFVRRDRKRVKGRLTRVWIGARIRYEGEEKKEEAGEPTLEDYERERDRCDTLDDKVSETEEVDEEVGRVEEEEQEVEEPEVQEWDLTDMIDEVESVESKQAIVLDIVRDLCERFKGGASLKKVIKAAKEREIDEKEVEEILSRLVEYGKVIEIKGKFKIVE